MLYFINLVGGLFEFHIGINYITAIFTGILGVPRSGFIGDTKTCTGDVKIIFYQNIEIEKEEKT